MPAYKLLKNLRASLKQVEDDVLKKSSLVDELQLEIQIQKEEFEKEKMGYLI